MAVVIDGGSLLTICENGFGKRTLFTEYRPQRRGGKGLIDIKTSARNGKVVVALSVRGDEQIMMMTSGGMLVRTDLADARTIGRNTQGIRLIRVREGQVVVGAEVAQSEDDDSDTDADGVSPGDSDVGGDGDAVTADSPSAEPSVDDDESSTEPDGEGSPKA